MGLSAAAVLQAEALQAEVRPAGPGEALLRRARMFPFAGGESRPQPR
jgi:hypothetical protein